MPDIYAMKDIKSYCLYKCFSDVSCLNTLHHAAWTFYEGINIARDNVRVVRDLPKDFTGTIVSQKCYKSTSYSIMEACNGS